MTTSVETGIEGMPQEKRDQKAKSSSVRTFRGAGEGLKFERYFSREGVHPYDEVKWEQRDATISNERGDIIFEQRNAEVPESWSTIAGNVVVSKYFRGQLGTDSREQSVRQLIDRVVDTITEWGKKGGYFASDEDAEVFRADLKHLVVHQKMAFNSPVWFNVGVEERPQASACFINGVDDSMTSILELAKTEGMLFKWGSGTGSNLSTIRSSREVLSGGGTASGPVSFMKGYDAFAGVIKSGGKTRRAAKMVILDARHPDIKDFVWSKASEEKKAWALIDQGYDGGFNVPGGAYDSVFFQNANHSVRVTDDFMQAVDRDAQWSTQAVTDGRPVETFQARELMHEIAEAAWICGDPGMQYDTTINDWHTCPNSGRINASNPCSEYMHLDNSACNLASLNLMKYRNEEGDFDVNAFTHAVRLTITAQEIIVDNASYPTPAIGQNARTFRQLGLGFANLGALLMARGLPYDSEEGRAYAGAITAVMCGEAYRQSAEISKQLGPFEGYPINEQPMLRVIDKHRQWVPKILEKWPEFKGHDLYQAATRVWDQAYDLGKEAGFRNSQATVLAPTGTIGLMMDCDTTGVEPDIALIKYKKLVGGGYFKIVNQTVPPALEQLGYPEQERKAITDYLAQNDTIEGAPYIKEEHLPVFDCAFKPSNGSRFILPMGHVRMMAAVQPFLSGAISKTVNMPTAATIEEIAETYSEAWKLGLKAIAIYRDGCKRTQPLSTKFDEGKDSTRTDTDSESLAAQSGTSLEQGEVTEKVASPTQVERSSTSIQPLPSADAQRTDIDSRRRRLPNERPSITHKFSIAGHEGYITVGMYDDGSPGEIFIVMSKEGSVVSGLMDSFATSISLCLQYGVPLRVLVDKFSHTRFEPSGFTNNSRIPIAKSVTDYIFRWLADKFLDEDERNIYLNEDEPEAWRPAPVGEPTDAASASAAETQTSSASGKSEEGSAHHKSESSSIPSSGSNGHRASNGNGQRQTRSEEGQVVYQAKGASASVFTLQADAPPCQTCGSIMVRSGSCYKCLNCGSTSGCS